MPDSESSQQNETKLFTTAEILVSISRELHRSSLSVKLQVARYVLEVLARKQWNRLIASPVVDKLRHTPFAIFIKKTTRLAERLPVLVLNLEARDVLDYIIMFILSFLMFRILLPR
jgi:menaquinone-dependent protoporphyrinogen IX oxidase